MTQRIIFITSLVFVLNISFSQNDYFSIDSNKITFYFSNTHIITIDSIACFYREYKFNNNLKNIYGEISDFTRDSLLIFTGSVKDGFFNGPAKYYYENGKIKIAGNYKNGKRDGVWEYYYPNGKLEKQIRFSDDSFYIINLYNRKGKHLVIEGNGKYKGIITLGLINEIEYLIKGEIKNYLLHGKWYIGTEIEKYNEGKFEKGFGSIVRGFLNPYKSEKFNSFITRFLIKSESTESVLLYDISDFEEFISKIKDELYNYNNKSKADNYTVFLSINLDTDKKLINYKTLSTDKKVETLIQNLIENSWSNINDVNTKYLSYSLFIPVECTNNQIIIPKIIKLYNR